MRKKRQHSASVRARLLVALQNDSAVSFTALAKELKVDASTLSRMRAELREQGIIIAERAILNAEKIGLGASMFVKVAFSKPDDSNLFADVEIEKRIEANENALATSFLEVATLLSRIPQILEIYQVWGESPYEMLLKVRGKSTDEIMPILFEILKEYRLSTQFIHIVSILKETTILPISTDK